MNIHYVYLSNKMTGIPYFNAPWFDNAAGTLRSFGLEVFNPADHDREHGFEPMTCETGTLEQALKNGFVLGTALVADWTWIGTTADAVIVGPDWLDSKGAISEIACAQAVRKPVYEIEDFQRYYGTEHLINYQLPPILDVKGCGYSAGECNR